jgi:hypothetical protein
MPGRLMVPGSAAAETVSPEIVSVVLPLACATVLERLRRGVQVWGREIERQRSRLICRLHLPRNDPLARSRRDPVRRSAILKIARAAIGRASNRRFFGTLMFRLARLSP